MKVRGTRWSGTRSCPPGWQALTGADAVREAMTRHIQTVVAHYRDNFPGVVVAYDVVNEAVNIMQGGMPGASVYRDSVFSRELGEGFIAEAFQIARDTDPDALLFYNDFGIEGMNGAKCTGAFNIVSGLVTAGVPIDGIGFQMHTGPTDQGPGAADFAPTSTLRGSRAAGRDHRDGRHAVQHRRQRARARAAALSLQPHRQRLLRFPAAAPSAYGA